MIFSKFPCSSATTLPSFLNSAYMPFFSNGETQVLAVLYDVLHIIVQCCILLYWEHSRIQAAIEGAGAIEGARAIEGAGAIERAGAGGPGEMPSKVGLLKGSSKDRRLGQWTWILWDVLCVYVCVIKVTI